MGHQVPSKTKDAMGAGMGVPGVHEAGGIFHHPHRHAGVRIFQELLGEQRLAQFRDETLLPGMVLESNT
jgi:hypothetical protein